MGQCYLDRRDVKCYLDRRYVKCLGEHVTLAGTLEKLRIFSHTNTPRQRTFECEQCAFHQLELISLFTSESCVCAETLCI